MHDAPKGLRLHIGVFGRRNVGKSSLLNALTGQPVSIVSDTPGTTTDPVEKTQELSPLGPVVFIDTAGLDDVGELGGLRAARTLKALDRADVAFLVTEPGVFGEDEQRLAALLAGKATPFAVVVNKIDQGEAPGDFEAAVRAACHADPPVVRVSAAHGLGLAELKEALVGLAPKDWFEEPRLLGDLLKAGDLAVLVVPIDLGAPKGRLILPQVQAIRDILDSDATAMVVKERELRDAFARLSRKPALVVCDSQVVLKTAGETPADVPMTTFSILMARFKGDLIKLAQGAAAIDRLRPGDRVLIAEACTHHPLADDIGRVKIPRWLRQYAGGAIEAEVRAGSDYPDDLSPYSLIIHCGACVVNRKAMLSRVYRAQRQDVAITNYGLAISFLQGVLPRALEPFPAARAAFDQARGTYRETPPRMAAMQGGVQGPRKPSRLMSTQHVHARGKQREPS
ncbi:[FeFe] hydrogenase H-cluster maturation GTPase HydF [Desulfolutivibrio sulfoxidireducens]|uniref:[FeFe] hydrogenase H-cluster maturation GTPase HydF n=1 Tax=Desulfolutivibrio sulfoxidireducens TaxID=2773299 RepID=UPI00159D3CDA|nr:[FeFe] hydrogenase H-cluster maturation GTPase HydF [Desulfolutivibrio sulfoxidireducens]QLA19082.1 [FeFe] hydrogenase H-cluster maturation GTPase HydF [Desulfolutivibrio sulfoxidireducens]